MAFYLSYFLIALASLVAIPITVLFIEIAAALTLSPRETLNAKKKNRERVAVLVPAHNESSGILVTLEDIKTQLLPGDRLLVVADNCIDDTAAIAATAGAEVITRNDPTRIGKGYALDFGLEHLRLNPPEIVIIIDADCRVAEGSIDQLAIACTTTHRPAQALDLMTASVNSSNNFRVAEFAWRVKNWVRPLGLNALSLPCQLMGTGMAFPWDVICSASLASGSIVEDLKLGLDLTRTGYPPLFCPSARVTSHFPLSDVGAQSQRKRWEEGHVKMILTTVPRFIYEALSHGNLHLLALTLDLAIPPLSFLVILLVGMCAVAGVAALFGVSSTALIISAICIIALALAVFLSWLKYGRDLLPARAIFSIASYIFAKLPIYHRVLSGSAVSKWTRTDRKNDT